MRGGSWQRSASCYESSWSPVTGRFASSLLDAVGAGPGTRLLDLACGPGTVAVRALERGCVVVGIDAADAMVRLAGRRLGRATVAVAEAERPPFGPAAFDAVTIGFGLHHFEDPVGALGAVLEALRPGGVVAYTVWAPDEESPGLEAINRAFSAIVPPEPGPDLPFGDAARFREALRELDFDDRGIELRRVERNWRPARAEDVFQAELEGGGRKTEMLARQTEARREEIRARVIDAVRRFEGPDGIALPMTAYVISARRRGGARGVTP